MAIEAIQPDIFILGLRIQEPVITATDLLITIASYYGYYRIHKAGFKDNSRRFLKLYFVFMGTATALAGLIGHGFLYYFGLPWKIPGWFLSMIAIMFIERSAIEHASKFIKKRAVSFFLKANLWELGIMMILTAYTLNFLFVEIHSGYGVLGTVFAFHLYVYRKTRDIGSRYMLWGVAVLVVATFVYNYPIVIDKWFTNSDFAHILMTITTVLFMYGGLNYGKVPDQKPGKTRVAALVTPKVESD
jgi:hypothetical protein